MAHSLLNPAGTVYGGFSATLLDSSMGLDNARTQDFIGSTDHYRDPSVYRRRGRAQSGQRVGTAEGRIMDGNGRLLVHGTTTCLIFER